MTPTGFPLTTRSIIIDCDPGVDDAIALLLAFASPELDLLGITTVAGNVPLALTQTNARKICELADRTDIPVYAGCPRPLMRSLTTAEEVHGKTGLEGVALPNPQMPIQSAHAVDFLIDTITQAQQPITLAVLGPLTNVAIALIKAPQIAANVAEIVLMGGSTTHGNVTPSAEFNMYVDPHAAHVVFTSGIPLTMLGLNLTHQVLTTPTRLAMIRALSTPVSLVAADLLSHYGNHEMAVYDWEGGPLHDPNVIAYLVRPDLYTSQPRFVAVETASELNLGRTVVDQGNMTGRSPNVQVVETVDVDGFYTVLTERLAIL